MSRVESPNVGILRHALRKVATVLPGAVIFRNEKPRNLDGLERAKELSKKGYGVIVVINHFSLKDPPQVGKLLFETQGLGSKKIHFPIAYHMYKMHRHGYDKILGRLFGITFKPVVTKSTIDKGKNDGLPLHSGGKEFLQKALGGLEKGEIVVIAPQETRQPFLGELAEKGIGTLIAGAKRNNLKIALLFIGLGIENVTDYSEMEDFNRFKKYKVNIGECFTNDEVMEQVNGDFRKVDNFVFRNLYEVVLPNYRKPLTFAA